MKTDFAVPQDKILLGVIVKAHGVKGIVVVHCFTQKPESLQRYKAFFLINKSGCLSSPLVVRFCSKKGTNGLLGFSEIETKEQVTELIGAGLLVEKTSLPKLAEGEFYWHQYEGKDVIDSSGQIVGKVEGLFDNGAQIILIIRDPKGKELFVPAVSEIIIREEKNRLVIAPPPGLLELNEMV